MVYSYIDNELSNEIFRAGMRQAAMEKKAWNPAVIKNALRILETIGKDVKGVGSTIFSLGEKAVGAASKIPPMARDLMMLGGGAGVLGTMAYHTVKDNISMDDPKEKLNKKLERLYALKTKETADAKWMARVRQMRDDLSRNYKNMTTEEYTHKYNALMSALDERRA